MASVSASASVSAWGLEMAQPSGLVTVFRLSLVGSPEPLIAFLDWVSTHGGDQGAKVWDATHPSNAARRKALLGVQSSRL